MVIQLPSHTVLLAFSNCVYKINQGSLLKYNSIITPTCLLKNINNHGVQVKKFCPAKIIIEAFC
jgi:hypothetical protein